MKRYLSEREEMAVKELTDERYNFLTENQQGIATVLAEFWECCEGEEIDKCVYKLWETWVKRGDLQKAADELCHILDLKAVDMAQKWALEELDQLQDAARDEPSEPYSSYAKAIEAHGVTGYASH